ncbi:Putative ankyrin repeat protein [Frankliniella fusca]|uniref:Ankyrin repeat protein n=1 Tax=Frankliniella fusca TaxID=407009 RepID=A0AAE1LRQ3_9NEOP|nr:Putative ankyrin repeat protein [Frankliniella fusca]
MAVVLGGRGDWPGGGGGGGGDVPGGKEEDAAGVLQDDDDLVLRRFIGEDGGAAPGAGCGGLLPWWCRPEQPGPAPTSTTAPSTSEHDPELDVAALLLTPSPEEEPAGLDHPEPAAAAPEQVTTLHCAVFRQDQGAVDRLLAEGADPDEPDYAGSGDTPLMQAVTAGHLGIVRSLCAAGCSVDARRVNGQSALMLCVASRACRRSPRLLLQLLEALLAAGADPCVREKLRGQTALHALAKLVAGDPAEAHLLTALRLLAQRAQPHGVNAQDHRRRTALHHLASRACARPEPYQILLEARADAALQNARGDTPLVEFLENAPERAEHGEEVVRLLCGAAVARRHTQYGESLLHVAARRNRLAAVRVALGAGADPAHQDLRGNTPLHLAAGRGYKDVVAELLAAPGCPVNATNRDGLTPLHVAVESGFVDVVNTLLGAEGVDVAPSVLELAQQEYRLRAQPQLARKLASELDRRMSLSLAPSLAPSPASTRPPSTCSLASCATTACKYLTVLPSGRAAATSQRPASRRTLTDEEDADAHPINFLGAQVSCTARIRPRYSAHSDQLAGGCVMAEPQLVQQMHRVQRRGERSAGKPKEAVSVWAASQQLEQQQAREARPLRAEAVDQSLREAAELMQKLCDEDLSVSPPADWSPPPPRAPPGPGLPGLPGLPLPTCAAAATSPRLPPEDDVNDDDRDILLSVGRIRRDSENRSADTPPAVSSTPKASLCNFRAFSTESRRGSKRPPTDSKKPRGKFNLPANPYATIRGSSLDDADDASDFMVESLLAVAKSITEPDDPGREDEAFDRTVEIPKDYELFERSVLFGGSGPGSRDGQNIGAMARGRASDTTIASR